MTSEEVRQRFKEAVGILADEAAGIKERLMIAFVSQLEAIDARQELPPHLVPEFGRIKVILMQDEVPGDAGRVSKELKKISNEQASQIARHLYDMFLELHGLPATGAGVSSGAR